MKINLNSLHIQLDDHTRLAPAEPSMASEIFKLTDENRDQLSEWLPWLVFTKTSKDTEKYLRSSWEQMENGECFQLAIVYRGKIVGMIGVHHINWTDKQTSIGYWLGAEAQGKGIMTRACRALINYLFTNLGLHRIEIRCATGNHKSRAIPERLGLKHEATLQDAELTGGQFHDSEVYSAIATKWSAE